jgi:hypothetical protein
MAPEPLWNDLAAAALLGTERRAFTVPEADGGLGPLLGGLAGRDPGKALLGAAATLALYRRAGRRPTTDPEPLPPPAPIDARPRPSPTAAAHLAQILSIGLPREVLAEWLTALDEAGRRGPEESLPALLEIGRTDRELRPALLAVLGERGRWLARQNPDWAYAGAGEAAVEPGATDAAWQTGTSEDRVALLRQLRKTDPARGRELVTSTWNAEEPSDRAVFLKAFEVGLSGDDEPFLEAALDDRRKEVRSAAVELLSRLPRSRLVRRVVERVARLLSLPVEGTLSTLESEPSGPVAGKAGPFARIELPEACDKAMQRDGIEPKPTGTKLGEKAWWLSQMLGFIPPTVWGRCWGCPPQDVVQAAIKGKWNDALYPALTRAAIRARDPDWIEALLPQRKRAALDLNDLRELIQALPPDRRERAMLGLLRMDAQGNFFQKVEELSDDGMMLLADHMPAPWGEDLAREILGRLPLNLAKARYYDYYINRFLKAAGAALPETMALQAASGWTVSEAIRSQFDEFVALLQFRHDMLKELSA